MCILANFLTRLADSAEIHTPAELGKFAELARVFVAALEAWHAPTLGAGISEQAMHRALHTSDEHFDSYCHAQPPARVRRALDDAKARSVPAQARVQLALVQLARLFEPRDAVYRPAHAGLSHAWRLVFQRARRRHARHLLPALERKRAVTLRSLPQPLNALLRYNESRDLRRYHVLMEGRRCGAKLWALKQRYGTGVLLLAKLVLNLARLYHCSTEAFAELEAQLALMPCFADFATAVLAAYEATMATMTRTMTRLPAVEMLRLYANKGSDVALRYAAEVGERTLPCLRSPLSPPLLTDADDSFVCSQPLE